MTLKLCSSALSLSLACSLLFACGQDSISDGDMGQGSGDMSDALDMAAPPSRDMAGDLPDAGEEQDLPTFMDYVNSVRVIRIYQDCALPECKQDVLFFLGNNLMWRYEYGLRVDTIRTQEEEHEELREMVLEDSFIEAIKSEDFGCPAQPDDADFRVLLMLHVDDDPSTRMIEVSGCHNSEREELPDAVVDYALAMERRYD